MSVRKREWTTNKGEIKSAWLVAYKDGNGKRCQKTFKKKKDADDYHATVRVELRRGVHVADSASVTVSEAGDIWIDAAEAAGLERTTVTQYRQHLTLHIAPFIGKTKLSQLTVPEVRKFEDRLAKEGRSDAMVRKVVVSLGSLLAEAQERGLVAQNVVHARRRRRRGKSGGGGRHKKQLEVGVDIPTPDEINVILKAAKGQWRPLLITAIFSGLRISELRGLTWSAVGFNSGELHVRQRADKYDKIGPPKSVASRRSVPVPPVVLDALREWKKDCPKGDLDLVFPNGRGNIESLSNIIARGLKPVQIAAKITVRDGDDVKAKYTGMHALRHFYASWCINRKEDGGMGLPPKTVQTRLGHSSIAVTMDTYGHLFPRGDDRDELDAAANAVLGKRGKSG